MLQGAGVVDLAAEKRVLVWLEIERTWSKAALVDCLVAVLWRWGDGMGRMTKEALVVLAATADLEMVVRLWFRKPT